MRAPVLGGPRSPQIVRLLLEADGPFTMQALASKLGVSARTLRSDLPEVRRWLAFYGVTVISKPRRGIWVEGQVERALAQLAAAVVPGYAGPLRPDQRVDGLALRLLHPGGTVSMARMAQMLAVSRSTVKADLGALSARLQELGLHLVSKPGSGLRAKGPEAAVRSALVVLAFGREDGTPVPTPAACSLAFDRAELDLMTAVVGLAGRWRARAGIFLPDDSYRHLLAHLLVAVTRTRAGYRVEIPPERLPVLTRTPEWHHLLVLASQVEAATGVSLEPADLGLIVLAVLGSAQRWANGGRDLAVDTRRYVDILLAEASAVLGLDLTCDAELRSGVEDHLGPVFLRRRLGLVAGNPLTHEMQRRYPLVYAAAAAGCRLAGYQVGVQLGTGEVAFLAMHLGAALERAERRQVRRVLVVCASGLGSARLLAAQLERHCIGLEIVSAVALAHLSREGLAGVDLVVSTVPLDLDCPVVQVSPLLEAADLERLAARGVGRRRVFGSTGPGQVATVLRLVERHAQVHDREGLRHDLEQLFAPRSLASLPVPAVDIASVAVALKTQVEVDATALERFVIHLELAMERARHGISLDRLPLASFRPELLEAVRGAVGPGVLPEEELELLAGVLASPSPGPEALPAQVAAGVARELGLDDREQLLLGRALRAAVAGARSVGMEFPPAAQAALAAHLAAVNLRGARLREVPLPPELRDQLDPACLRAGEAMAEAVAAVMGTRPRSWEAELLAVHAGAARLHGLPCPTK
ncbi:MAG: HTH domain-containing protein [Bacillota bacterium]